MAVVASEAALETRAHALENALATVRLEGLEPSPEAKRILERYAAGELTLEEMGAEMDAYADREYGPVRLPANQRT